MVSINILNYKFITDKIFLFSLILLPLSFQIGIAVSEILFNLSLLLSVYIFNRENLKVDKQFLIILLVIYLYLIFSSIINYYIFHHQVDLIKSFSYIRFFIFFIFIKEILNINDVKKILKYNVFLLSILLIDIVFQKLFGENILGYSSVGSRNSSFFGSELIAGSYISKFFFPVFIFICFFMIKNKNSYITFFLLLFINICIFFTGERAALISFFTIIFLSIFFIKELRKIIMLHFFVVIVSLAILINFAPKKLGRFDEIQKIFFDKKYILNLKKENQVKDNLASKFLFIFESSDHIYLFNTAKNIWIENKVIGTGIKTFRHECKKKIYNTGKMKNLCSTHPHNYFLEIISELGIIGIILFITFFLMIIKRFYKYFKNNYSFSIYLYSSFFINFLSFLLIITSGRFFSNWISIIFWLNLTLMFSIEKNLKNSSN